ncbi:MAG: ATP-binding protein, partial [Candidatus Desantisbacteria bacterium]
ELNNPLGGILGYAQFILEKLRRPELSPDDLRASSKYIESIEKEASRCKRIVENLLKFSRRPISVKPEPIDIAQAIDETLSIIGHQLKLKNVNVTLDTKPGSSKVLGITNQLQQVFTNLILNAQQAMPEGGELKITCENIPDESTHTPKAVRIEFTDTGCGIPEEHLAHMFEPFFTTKQSQKGTGLGLAVSYQIISDHKGTIEVKSEVGKGTTFTIILPAINK